MRSELMGLVLAFAMLPLRAAPPAQQTQQAPVNPAIDMPQDHLS